MKKIFKRVGSATLMVIMFAAVFTLYATSTYADVRHMKNKYESYESEVINQFEQEYEQKQEEI